MSSPDPDLLLHLPTCTSTNDVARDLAAQGAPHGTAVRADTQTAGRGRLGRRWESPPGANVYLSIVLRTPVPPDHLALLCLGAAVATARACGPAYRIKWPNDVQAPDGRKVAGLLAEAEWDQGRPRFVVLGVGVNVNAAPPLDTATCLAADGQPRDPADVARQVHQNVLVESERVLTDPEVVLAAWRERANTLGQRVRVGEIEGDAVDVDASGALLVRTTEGLRRILAGDVEVVARRWG